VSSDVDQLLENLVDQAAARAAELVLKKLGSIESPSAPSEFLSVPEACELARCSRQRLYDLRSSGRLSKFGDGSRALVSRAELIAYLGERTA
jgi:excisionase family DNA binding protein